MVAEINDRKKFSVKVLIQVVLVIAGIVVGWLFTTISYATETQRTLGFPLPWAAFEKRNGNWIDFVGPLSIFIYFIDILSGICCVYLAAACLRLCLKVRNRTKRA